MTVAGILQLLLLILALVVTVRPLGRYMFRVYSDGPAPGDRVFGPIEKRIYRIARIDPDHEQRWNVYTLSLLAFSVVSFAAVYLVLRLQGHLPFNPNGKTAIGPWGAFNISVSFLTNTNWQWYSGEVALSHLTQMLSLAVQNFVSAAAGMAVAVALIRGISRRGGATLGNFWRDLIRTTTRILLPLSFIIALFLVSQGVVQNFKGSTPVKPLDQSAQVVTQQIPGGPAASQVAIKQLGTNGGGFFNANSAHPFENPNAWTNFVETYLILALPFALVVMFGLMVGSKKQGRVLFAVMMALFLSFSLVTAFAEQGGNPRLTAVGVDQSSSGTQVGGNLEGKEVRFGPASCGLWAGATTGTSNGSINCAHDSLTPIGGLAPLTHMMLGEVSPGGVGVGIMGMLVNALLAVFIAGLMVGRTPEYLGKKIQAAEMKLVVLYIIAMPLALLTFAAAAVLLKSVTSTTQGGTHGLSEVLYNYASSANNNGSAFGYVNTSTRWWTSTQGISMLMGRFFLIIPALAVGGSLVRKVKVPETAGTFPTDTPLFGGLLVGVVVIVAGLTFFPALALGPIVEHLSL